VEVGEKVFWVKDRSDSRLRSRRPGGGMSGKGLKRKRGCRTLSTIKDQQLIRLGGRSKKKNGKGGLGVRRRSTDSEGDGLGRQTI